MWLIDMTAGLNSVLLFEALFSIKEKCGLFLRNSLEECNVPYLEEVRPFLRERKQFNIKALHAGLAKYPPFNFGDAVACTGRFSSVFKKMIEYADEDTIDAFHHFLYLSMIILLENIKKTQKVTATIPGIGTASPSSSMNMLKGRQVILDAQAETVPPMLAAILLHYFVPFTDVIRMRILEVREIRKEDGKRGIRLIRGEEKSGQGIGYETGMVCVIETNIDDTTPEVIGEAMTEVLSAGALDYTVVPATMKKGRMGCYIQVLTKPEDVENIVDLLLKSTSTFGIRFFWAERLTLSRNMCEVETLYGKVRVKQGYKGKTLLKQMPEFDDLVEISRRNDIPIHVLYTQIMGEIKKTID
jgi:hypothetical protein